jgi:hypothetical protein
MTTAHDVLFSFMRFLRNRFTLAVVSVVVATLGLAALPAHATVAPPPPPHLAATDAGPGGTSRAAGAETARLVYLTRNWVDAPATGATSLGGVAIPVTIDLTANAPTGYFYGTQFYIKGLAAGAGGYLGLQTDLFNPSVGYVGKGVIGSFFGATGATANTADGSFVVHSTESGSDFWSVRRPYNWVPNHNYLLSVSVNHVGSAGYLHRLTIWVVDQATGVQTQVGIIYLPSTSAGMEPTTISWSELYKPQTFPTCNDIPISRVTYALAWMQLYNYTNQNATGASTSMSTTATCTNSGITDLGGGSYREIVGATS